MTVAVVIRVIHFGAVATLSHQPLNINSAGVVVVIVVAAADAKWKVGGANFCNAIC